jgi:hypothetical protein
VSFTGKGAYDMSEPWEEACEFLLASEWPCGLESEIDAIGTLISELRAAKAEVARLEVENGELKAALKLALWCATQEEGMP